MQHINALTCKVEDTSRVKKAFESRQLDISDFGPHDYRGYLGEYPSRLPYRQRKHEPIPVETTAGGIDFRYVEIRQLRDREWERDYSQVVVSSSLLMPAGRLPGDAARARRDVGSAQQD